MSRSLLIAVSSAALLMSCGGGDGDGEEEPPRTFTDLRVYRSPYADVDWSGDTRLKGQHHDHSGTSDARILAYDAAGYDAIGLMSYSGNPTLDYAWTQRRWPPSAWLSPSLMISLSSIKVFIPNAEEVGDQQNHATSPGLTTYVEGRPSGQPLQPFQYSTIPQLFTLIRQGGGVPCLAHPWNSERDYAELSGRFCVEIYSAYAEAQRRKNVADFVSMDRNARLLANWDRALVRNQEIFGIAVNDHYGPDSFEPTIGADILDSGKILVLARTATLESYLEALGAGRFFAIRDQNTSKDQVPSVDSISADASSLNIVTNGTVRWISHGQVIAQGSTLPRTALPANARYVRAEIQGQGAVTLFTQAFWIRPVGDVDGDYDIDDADEAICANPGTISDPVRSEACNAGSGNP
jgi:hypothetical protein